MIIIQDTFVCKPGNASKMAKQFKEAMAGDGDLLYVMSDMTGEFNRVVMVSKYENLSAYEEAFKKYMNPTPEMKEAMAKMDGYQEKYLTGSREIFKVW